MSDYPAEPTAGDAARDTFCELARAVVGLEADGADTRSVDGGRGEPSKEAPPPRRRTR